MIMPMPIHSHQVYPYNANDFSIGGVTDYNFNSHQKQLYQQQQQQQQQQQGPVDPSVFVHNSNVVNSLEKPWQEIDQYIKFQNDQMRLVIQERGKQHMAAMLKDMESQSALLLKKKDEEIVQAANKRLELEHFIRRLEAENWIWKKEAQDKEDMVLALHTALEEQKNRMTASAPHGFVANDVESHWDETNGVEVGEEVGTWEKKVEEQEQITRKEVMVCKSCHSRRVCILFLPCRHLASCKSCDAVLKACPVCGGPKKSSIETLNF